MQISIYVFKNYLKFELEQINKKYNRIEISLLLNMKDVTK